jgi:hypothetical protein
MNCTRRDRNCLNLKLGAERPKEMQKVAHSGAGLAVRCFRRRWIEHLVDILLQRADFVLVMKERPATSHHQSQTRFYLAIALLSSGRASGVSSYRPCRSR